MAEENQDWFAANAPQQATQEPDWFAQNAPKPVEPQQGGVVSGIVAGLGRALNPINLVKGALDIGNPSDISKIYHYGKTLGEIVTGTPPSEAIGQNIPELQQQREAVFGQQGTREQAAALTGVGLQLGMVALPFLHGRLKAAAPEVAHETPLAEVAGIAKPPITEPITPVQTEAVTPPEVLGKVEPVAPITPLETDGVQSVNQKAGQIWNEMTPEERWNHIASQDPFSAALNRKQFVATTRLPWEDIPGGNNDILANTLLYPSAEHARAAEARLAPSVPQGESGVTAATSPKESLDLPTGTGEATTAPQELQVLNEARLPNGRKTNGLTVLAGDNGALEIQKQPDGTAEMFNLRVNPDAQRQGIATQMLQRALDEIPQIQTDDAVTHPAAKTIESLSQKGYSVEKNPLAKPVEIAGETVWQTPDGSPVYKISKPASPVSEAPVSTTGSGIQKESVPTEPPPTPVVNEVPQSRGISQAKTEAELGAGSVEPGIGAELGSGIEYGRDFINKGGDPRLPIRRATTTGLVGKNEVGIVHAELERLRGERSKAAQALEANPDDPELQKQFTDADNAQRAWRKELQPVLTKASDTLREAYAGSTPDADAGTYQGLADLFDEHFNGSREITPEMRTQIARAAKGVRDTREIANNEMKNVEGKLVSQMKGKKVMTPEELDADLKSVLEGAFKNCVAGR